MNSENKSTNINGKFINGLILAATILLASHQIRKIDSRAVGCGGKPADVVFLLDASNSIWGPHFRRQLQFVKDIADWFPVGRDATHVALVTYADYPQLQFALDDHFTKPQLRSAVDAVRQNGGHHTRTGAALAYARRNVLFGGGGEGAPRRPNVTKVVVVITDGLSDDRAATVAEAERTKAAGVHVFAVGVGKDVDRQELDAIASSPSKYYTFLVDGYEGLGNILELLAIKACTVTDPTTTTSSTVATTTTASTTTTTSSATTTSVSSSYENGDDYLSTVSHGEDQTPTAHDNHGVDKDDGKVDDGDKDKDNDNNSDDMNETMRTPLILPPPTFIPDPSESSLVAEFKVPDGTGDSIGASNCSLGGGVRTDSDDNDTEITDRTEKAGDVPVATRAPCHPNGNLEDVSVRPESGKINEGHAGNRSASSTGANGYVLINEHGYWVGTRFVRFQNGTAGGRDHPDVQPLTGRNESSHHNVFIDSKRITEGDVKEKKGTPDRNDPRYRVYINSGPRGTGGGYWYRDEQLGYVWYRYVRPGVFELDLNTTYKMREKSGQGKENRTTEAKASSFNDRENDVTISERLRVTSEPRQYESTANSGSENMADFKTSPQTSNGYWGRDGHGAVVWYRQVGGGSYQMLYPKDTDKQRKDDKVTDEKSDGNVETSTVKLDSGPKIRFQSSTSHAVGTPSTGLQPGERSEDRGGNSEDSRQAAEGINHDFWTFATGRRVWYQYVPPNGLSEDDEGQLEQLRGPSNALEIPLDAVLAAADGNRTDRRRFSAERRRVWHSSRAMNGNGSVASSEELSLHLGPRGGADDSAKVRLDDERGRHLWRQLMNFTRLKPPVNNSFSELRNRFEVLKGELGDSGRNGSSEQLHESYWFYDDTGRRFQVIHRYNASAVDELKLLDESEDSSLSQGHFLPKQLIGDFHWEQGKPEEHGRQLKDHDKTRGYEKYGGEYWIRVLSSADDKDNSEKGNTVETRPHRRTNISIELSIENNNRTRPPQRQQHQHQPTTVSVQKQANRPDRKKPGRREGGKKKQKNNSSPETGKNALVKPDKGKPSEERSGKRQGRKSNPKGCRPKLPINIIFATISDNEDRVRYILDIAQVTAANLTARSTAGVLVGYYPEDGANPDPGRATKKTANISRRRAGDNIDMFSSIGRMFSEYAAERKKSAGGGGGRGGGGGGTRTRKILVLLIDGESEDQEEEERSGKVKQLGEDVELYAVGVGAGANEKRLEKLALYSKSRRKQVFPQNSDNISETLLSAMCL